MIKRLLSSTMIIILLLIVFSSCASKHKIISSVALEDDDSEWLSQNINDFALRSSSLIFANEKDDNMLYSPASIYMNLSMLYELSSSDSETREEIRALLQPIAEGDQAALCNALYQNMVYRGETGQLRIGNSIWASPDIADKLPKDALQIIEDAYRGKVFTTKLDDTSKMERWIADMTDGQMRQLPVDPESGDSLLLLSTVLFQEEWVEKFSESSNKDDVFYLSDSGETTCSYMTRTDSNSTYIQTDTFSAARMRFRNGFAMHFILPADGLLPTDLLQNPDILSSALDYSENNASILRGDIVFTVPKLKFANSINLIEAMREMGMEHAVTPSGGFTASLFVTKIAQDTRFEMDEQGAKAFAVTEDLMSSSAPPPPTKILNFTLNRPFLFFITSRDGYIVFTGIVNNPALMG